MQHDRGPTVRKQSYGKQSAGTVGKTAARKASLPAKKPVKRPDASPVRRTNGRPKRVKKPDRTALIVRGLIVLLTALLVFSASQLILYGVRSVRTYRTNAELEAVYLRGETKTGHATAEPTEAEETQMPVEADVPPMELEENEADVPPEEPEYYQYIGTEIAPFALDMYGINSDYIGWIRIPGVVNLPVVYRDNEYYLTHDFYGRDNKSGTVFLDGSHSFGADAQYLLLHGHAMYDGSIFGLITHYRNEAFIQKHPRLIFTTLYSVDQYEVIGSLRLTQEEMYSVAGLGRRTFEYAEAFDAFIDELRAHAIWFTEERIPSNSAIMALSTCYQDDRIVVFFRRIASDPAGQFPEEWTASGNG